MPVWTSLATLLVCAFLFSTGLMVALARRKTGLKAPAVTGHPDFERAYRVQVNSLEWAPVMLPSLWLCALFVSDWLAAALGVVWVAGRVVYMLGYLKAADRRGPGFMIQFVATAALWLTAFGGIVAALIRTH